MSEQTIEQKLSAEIVTLKSRILGYIDLGEFHHAVAQFVTDLDLVDDSPVAGLDLLPGYAVVVDEILDHGVGSLVSGPLAGIDACVIDVPELVHGDGFALGNDFGADKFADAGGQMPGVQTSLLGARTVPREERSLLQAPAYERR